MTFVESIIEKKENLKNIKRKIAKLSSDKIDLLIHGYVHTFELRLNNNNNNNNKSIHISTVIIHLIITFYMPSKDQFSIIDSYKDYKITENNQVCTGIKVDTSIGSGY